MAKQNITLKIEGREYPLGIDSSKEEVYRLAERELKQYLAQIKQARFKDWTTLDYMTMAALQFAIANINQRLACEVGSEGLQRLEALDSALDNYLNRLDR